MRVEQNQKGIPPPQWCWEIRELAKSWSRERMSNPTTCMFSGEEERVSSPFDSRGFLVKQVWFHPQMRWISWEFEIKLWGREGDLILWLFHCWSLEVWLFFLIALRIGGTLCLPVGRNSSLSLSVRFQLLCPAESSSKITHRRSWQYRRRHY